MRMTKTVKGKIKSYAAVTNTIFSMFDLDLGEDNIVIDVDTRQPVLYNNKILKRHTLKKIANIQKGELELDFLTGNTKILEFFFEMYLDKNEIDYKGFGFSINKGKKSKGTVDTYSWCLVLDNESDDTIEVESDYFKHKNIGLIQILFQLESVDMDEDLNLIDK